jgi:hypothetical protein
MVLANPLSGSSVDGSKVVHAAVVYQPSAPVQPLDKSKTNVVRFVPDASENMNGMLCLSLHAINIVSRPTG